MITLCPPSPKLGGRAIRGATMPVIPPIFASVARVITLGRGFG